MVALCGGCRGVGGRSVPCMERKVGDTSVGRGRSGRGTVHWGW